MWMDTEDKEEIKFKKGPGIRVGDVRGRGRKPQAATEAHQHPKHHPVGDTAD